MVKGTTVLPVVVAVVGVLHSHHTFPSSREGNAMLRVQVALVQKHKYYYVQLNGGLSQGKNHKTATSTTTYSSIASLKSLHQEDD